MDLYKTIHELYAEKQKLDRTIAALEGLLIVDPAADQQWPKRRGRKSMDAAERRQVSERMKKYWASRRAKRQ
ncbi:MAG: hypothetical protein C5B51_22625 [Terriglobia bacterium]|nr:MAG: hypothetical protein C5B51_22625 [Terriglobia bacterium]